METRGKLTDVARQLLAQLDNANAIQLPVSRRRVAQVAQAEEQHEGEVVGLADVVPAPDMKANVFFQLMEKDAPSSSKSVSIRDKVEVTHGDPLTLRVEDIVAANAVFEQFEQYHTHLQDASIDLDIDSIKQLMDRIKNAIAPEMQKMIQSLTSTNSNVAECRDLLDVVKVAQVLGKTVEELQKAIRENDRVRGEIERKERNLKTLTVESEAYQETVDAAQKAIDDHHGTFWGGTRQSVFGVPSKLQDPLTRAQQNKAKKDGEVEKAKGEIVALEAQLQKDLDEGPLKILRTFDLTQHSLKDKIHDAAGDVIKVIETIRSSVKTLIGRVAKSEVAMGVIIDKIDNNRMDRTVLISGLTEAYQANQEQADKVGERVTALQAKLDELPADSVEASKIRIEHLKQGKIHKGLLEYGERINTMNRMLHENDATSVLSSNEADRVLTSVHNNKDGLNTLHNSTLPALSEAMRLVLHQFVDEQDQQFRMAISEVTKNLGKTAEGTAERALVQQKEFHEQKMKDLNQLIERLSSASDLLGRAMEESVKAAVTEEKTYAGVTAAANDLREGVTAAGEIRSQVRERVRGARDGAEKALKDPSPEAGEGPALPGGGFFAPPKAPQMALHL